MKVDELKHLVFVYGSLKRGYQNNVWLNGSIFKGPHTTPPTYTMKNLDSFPGVITSGTTSIKGELYLVNDKCLNGLDCLEGYPDFYDKHTIPTVSGDAVMYVLAEDSYNDCENVMNGEW